MTAPKSKCDALLKYSKAVGAAQHDYYEAMATLRRDYDEAITAAERDYEKAVAIEAAIKKQDGR